jgi:hypothetical protein
MYTLEEMLMPDEVLFGNFNNNPALSYVFLNPKNHFPIIGLAGSTPSVEDNCDLKQQHATVTMCHRYGAVFRRLQRLPSNCPRRACVSFPGALCRVWLIPI